MWLPAIGSFLYLISDIGMAEMDGYDFTRRVRELSSSQNKFIPAIAITAYTSVEDRAAVLSAGFQIAYRQTDRH